MKALFIFFLLSSAFARDTSFDCYQSGSREKLILNITSTNDFTLLFPYQIEIKLPKKTILGFGTSQETKFEEKVLVFKNLLTIKEEVLELDEGSVVKLKTPIKNFQDLDCRVTKNIKYAWN